MTKFQASFLAFAGGVSYGFLSGFTKKAYAAGIETGALTTVQLIIGCTILWMLAFIFRKQASPKPSRSQVWKLLAVGIFPGLTGVFYYLSLKTLPASIAVILLFQFTWMGVIFDLIFDKRQPTINEIIAIAFIVPGTIMAIGNLGYDMYKVSLEGVILGLLSALTYTVFLYSTGRVAPDITPWLRSPIIITGSLITNLIVFQPFYYNLSVVTKELFLWGSLMGVFGPVIPTVCLTFSVPFIGGGLAAILGSVELPMVLLVAYFLLGEHIQWLQWCGAFIIFFGIYLGNKQAIDMQLKKAT